MSFIHGSRARMIWACLALVAGSALPMRAALAQGCPGSPILIDMAHDGIQLGAAGVGVHFDINADGVPNHMQWVAPNGDEEFLALDRNGNGIVDDGGELFGDGTSLPDGTFAPNGFVALAQYDAPERGGNDDGLITRADAIWSRLQLWHDVNADGISVAEEMRPLAGSGIHALQTIPKRKRHTDEAGNLIPFWAWAFDSTPPRPTLMVDVFFLMLD